MVWQAWRGYGLVSLEVIWFGKPGALKPCPPPTMSICHLAAFTDIVPCITFFNGIHGSYGIWMMEYMEVVE